MKEIDWEKIYQTSFVDFLDCHLTCGGHCCKNVLGRFFKILNQKSVILPLLESEYLYYQSKGTIPKITKSKKQVFHLRNGKTFVLYFLFCECGGLCEPHALRPLICRIYPYFPIINAKGEILDFYPASLMDLFYPFSSHPCTLIREHDKILKEKLSKNLQILLEIPLFIFVFLAMELLAKTLQNYLQNPNLSAMNEEEKQQFTRELELCLLSNKAWGSEEFKTQIAQIYEEVKKTHGGGISYEKLYN